MGESNVVEAREGVWQSIDIKKIKNKEREIHNMRRVEGVWEVWEVGSVRREWKWD